MCVQKNERLKHEKSTGVYMVAHAKEKIKIGNHT